jgi:hypothetical protein
MTKVRHLSIALVLCWGVLTVPSSRVVAKELSEYQLKAAFLMNFANFTEWPVHSFPDGLASVFIGVVGDDPFGRDLDNSVKDKVLSGHPITVKRVDWRDELQGFHILFVSASEQRHLTDILRKLESSSALTVSDLDGFCTAGGMIGFVVDKDRVRFEVNADIAQRRGLRISSKLLSLATNVHTKGNQP